MSSASGARNTVECGFIPFVNNTRSFASRFKWVSLTPDKASRFSARFSASRNNARICGRGLILTSFPGSFASSHRRGLFSLICPPGVSVFPPDRSTLRYSFQAYSNFACGRCRVHPGGEEYRCSSVSKRSSGLREVGPRRYHDGVLVWVTPMFTVLDLSTFFHTRRENDFPGLKIRVWSIVLFLTSSELLIKFWFNCCCLCIYMYIVCTYTYSII